MSAVIRVFRRQSTELKWTAQAAATHTIAPWEQVRWPHASSRGRPLAELATLLGTRSSARLSARLLFLLYVLQRTAHSPPSLTPFRPVRVSRCGRVSLGAGVLPGPHSRLLSRCSRSGFPGAHQPGTAPAADSLQAGARPGPPFLPGTLKRAFPRATTWLAAAPLIPNIPAS